MRLRALGLQADILHRMEAAYLLVLIGTFVAIAVAMCYLLAKLFAGQR